MKYFEALRLVELNSHLLGKPTCGGRIDELIIYPTDHDFLYEFKKKFILTRNAKESISEYSVYDVRVAVLVDSFRIDEDAVFIFYDLATLEDNLKAVLQ